MNIAPISLRNISNKEYSCIQYPNLFGVNLTLKLIRKELWISHELVIEGWVVRVDVDSVTAAKPKNSCSLRWIAQAMT